MRLRGHIADGAKVEEVHVTGGSLCGSAMIATDTYQSALALVCRETPIIQLQWHLEEEVSPELTAELLEDATDLAESANGSSHAYSDSIVPEMDGNDLRQDWRQFFN